jgi:hypothetical protein
MLDCEPNACACQAFGVWTFAMFTVPTAGRTIRFDFIDRLFFSVRSSLKVERVYYFTPNLFLWRAA